MGTVIEVLLQAGRGAVDVALYTLLPIMAVMMILVRLLEVWGVLDRLIALLAPVVRPFGLTGLGVLAMLQVSFVSFAAPISTLALMEDRGASDRHLAAALAAVLAMAPANAVFPLAALGLRPGPVLGLSALGGLAAAATSYWVLGRRLSSAPNGVSRYEEAARERPTFLSVINVSGREAIELVINIIPMLLLSLAVVFGLQRVGAVAALVAWLTPTLNRWGVDPALILPTVTKYLAGSTALVGVIQHMAVDKQIGAAAINAGAPFLLHPLDLPGVGIFMSASARLGHVLLPALGGACLGIALRTLAAALLA